MSNKTLKEDLDDLGKAFEKLGVEIMEESKSILFWMVIFQVFFLGMFVQHYFGESTILSILWK